MGFSTTSRDVDLDGGGGAQLIGGWGARRGAMGDGQREMSDGGGSCSGDGGGGRGGGGGGGGGGGEVEVEVEAEEEEEEEEEVVVVVGRCEVGWWSR